MSSNFAPIRGQLAGQNVNTIVTYSAEEIKTNLPKIKQNITDVLQKHQSDVIHSNRKLELHSLHGIPQADHA